MLAHPPTPPQPTRAPQRIPIRRHERASFFGSQTRNTQSIKPLAFGLVSPKPATPMLSAAHTWIDAYSALSYPPLAADTPAMPSAVRWLNTLGTNGVL